VQGTSRGFDDTFAFFPVDASIPVSSGISSFTVTINRVDGSKTSYNNNGKGYPVRDGVFLQGPQTCRPGSGNSIKLVAAVRKDRVSLGARATVHYKVAQAGSPVVAAVRSETVEMKKGACVGQYTFFTADYTIKGGVPGQAHVDVRNGDEVDGFKSVRELRESCRVFSKAPSC
jgi:hypothetical protein